MLNPSIIKICGICDEITAKHAIHCGADWIGFVFHPASKRNIDITVAAKISQTVHALGAKTVGVFVDQTVDEIITTVKRCNLDFAQLHGDIARNAYANLPDNIARIYAVQVEKNNYNPLPILNSHRDYLLFDALNPGAGEVFDWNTTKIDSTVPWILAGGLNTANISNAMCIYQPQGFDVSSGVEVSPGVKNNALMSQFIRLIRGT